MVTQNLKKNFWDEPVPEEIPPEQLEFSPADESIDAEIPDEVLQAAAKSRELLDHDGYCLWRCSTLKGETIVILNDSFNGLVPVPRGYPVWLLSELENIELIPDSTLRLAYHLIKSGVRLQITSVRPASAGDK